MVRSHSDGPALPVRGASIVTSTPPDRDRVVDLVRAGALCLVVVGHWLKQGLYVDGSGGLHRAGLLGQAEWIHPLTWLFQVMPLIFVVGGFANGLSWRRATARGVSYGNWLEHRIRRLTLPLVPLLVLWGSAPVIAPVLGLGPDWLHVGSKTALPVTWFLAAYLVVVALTPVTYALWRRAGWWTIAAAGVAAALVDLLSLGAGLDPVGRVNVLLVWGTLHQCGYAWLDRRRAGHPAVLACGGLACLVVAVLLVLLGPYGVSMVGVDGFGVNNTSPARVTILFLGWTQLATVMAIEPWLRRLAHVPAVWAAVVLVDLRAMTIYLWHLTSLSLLAAAALLLEGVGLHSRPTSREWWLSRPSWAVVLVLTTALVVALVGRLEQPATVRQVPVRPPPLAVAAPLLEIAAVVSCLAFLAKYGVGFQSGGAGGTVALGCVVCVLALMWSGNGRGGPEARRRKVRPPAQRVRQRRPQTK